VSMVFVTSDETKPAYEFGDKREFSRNTRNTRSKRNERKTISSYNGLMGSPGFYCRTSSQRIAQHLRFLDDVSPKRIADSEHGLASASQNYQL
jgi:hypothetical protein